MNKTAIFGVRPYTNRSARLLGLAIIGILTLLPILNILWITFTTGANNLSNDYQRFISLVDHILSCKYEWRNYFKDTLLMNGSQSHAFPFLIRLVIIKLTHWNIYVELAVGFLLALFRLGLVYSIFTRHTGGLANKLILPLIAALIFSNSQINLFTNGVTALEIGTYQLAATLGIWALHHYHDRWPGILLMSASGMMATLSSGGGLVVWPVFLIGLALYKIRKFFAYLILTLACIASSWPYLIYRLSESTSPQAISFNIEYFIIALGLLFANQTGGGVFHHPQGFYIGLWTIVLIVSVLVILWIKRKTSEFTPFIPSLMFIQLGIFNALQISLTRSALAPWYTGYYVSIWLGLVGLAYALWTNKNAVDISSGRWASWENALIPIWSFTLLLTVAVLYLFSNLTYRDKVFYLYSRSPASASCLRLYQNAPTYCEGLVFQWGVGKPTYLSDLAWPLQKHNLSVFAPRQEWALQGDFVFDQVSVEEVQGVPQPYWTFQWSGHPAGWSDYHHLNLFLPTPNRISWTVHLPPNLKEAVFRSAVTMDKYASDASPADGVRFMIYIKAENEDRQLAYNRYLPAGLHRWQKIEIPLSGYRGKAVTILIKSKGNKNFTMDWPVIKYPVIDLELEPTPPQINKPDITPANTDLNPNLPAISLNDFRETPEINSEWQISGVSSTSSDSQNWFIEDTPVFEISPSIQLRADEFSHFYIKLAASADIYPRAARLFYRLNDQSKFSEQFSFWIPLLADEDLHTYTYDLKLLPLPDQALFTGFKLEPVMTDAYSKGSWINISEIGLIRSPANKSDSP